MRVFTPALLTLLVASAAVVLAVTTEKPPGSNVPSLPSQERQRAEQAPPPAPAPTRSYPRLPGDPAAIASQLAAVETALRSASTPAGLLPELGHRQQVIYRRLALDPLLAARVRVSLEVRWQGVFDRHLAARREFLAMHRGGPRSAVVPAWRIIPPEPAANLLRYYREASAATGIPWEVLAAVNLVETGMGRIDGVSVADARGPMQFLPSTWAEPGIGQGDIRDPEDAIHAAARYLVRRGGLKDIRKGLWGYNNSNRYVRGVLLYAELLRQDPQAFTGLYNWEIHYNSAAGDLWLPVGYNQPRPLPVTTYLKRYPASAPPGR
ncbi:lytic transglycosylase domain-containing protein [Cyanobium gracile]|uniref:Lytic transglycosylase domain-containing protein n=1 Tax=Cyanobium gracile UHCC 0281 TaxID=3110309 RepID=A0ABU5SSM4_9CYAN|nr:lytic transglycosylase domain-containing protein [Cyanobium gracile]MEA5441518.1 lytic transglycosylase domain-containing protein [Cyanobium gracile UHCC 0281]